MINEDIIILDRCYGTSNFDGTFECCGYTIEQVAISSRFYAYTISAVVVGTGESFTAYITDKSLSITIGNEI